ncbi:MAG: D-alanyl-D-alanine carboxypeptidase [Austwickia sp.]|nr:MAG: D-alanyl-D-alanine carboxypeptidase [Austwickia sp.]
MTRAAAPAGAARLGVVRSAPVGDQLALALAESDNTLSSALARVAAVRTGVAPTFPAVAAWVVARVAALGVPTDGLVVADPSGLAPGSKASAATLAALLVKGTDGSSPELARVYADLPAAGLIGTLAERYLTGPGRAGAGLVRAKTGTLTGVSSLAGTVVDADGRLLTFAVLADQVPADGTDPARQALDRFAARLASCGCR